MITVLLVCLLAGAVLGQRFKVFILLPAMVPALFFALLVVAMHGATVGRLLAAALIAATSLQMGYLGGIGVRHLAVAERANRLRFRGLAVSASPRPVRRLADNKSRAAQFTR
jgi:hypothetical protein